MLKKWLKKAKDLVLERDFAQLGSALGLQASSLARALERTAKTLRKLLSPIGSMSATTRKPISFASYA